MVRGTTISFLIFLDCPVVLIAQSFSKLFLVVSFFLWIYRSTLKEP